MENRCRSSRAALALVSALARPFLAWLCGPFAQLLLLLRLTLSSSY